MLNKRKYLLKISVVVIGLNEADNLDDTFDAINELDYPQDKIEVIYCDTGSDDNSVEIATKYASKVFIEKSSWPTPGLARNRGLIEASHEFIHFIDGDIQIDKNYLKKAVAKIKEPNIHAVYGYLQEKSKKGFNEVLISRWSQKIAGFSNATGGGGTYKKSCLLKVNGYDERIPKGQETELGERFRKAGFNIWLLDCKMGVHNYGIKNIFDYFILRLKQGKSNTYNSLIKNESNSEFFQSNKKYGRKNIFFNLIFCCILIISICFNSILYLIIPFFFYINYLFIKFKYIKRIKGNKILFLNLLNILTKPIFLIGQMLIFFKYIFTEKIKKQKYIKEKTKIF